MIKPAIVAVGYNRPDGIKRLLDSIGRAKYEDSNITLIISIDESNRSNEVETVAKEFQWLYGEKIIRRFPERQGLRKHIVQCGDYSEKYGAVIILEDDLVVAKDFYTYTCLAHEMYSEDSRICGVALYSHSVNQFSHLPFTVMQNGFDVYLGDMIVTWGQSWTYEQWSKFKSWYLIHEDKLLSINIRIPKDISSWTRSWGRYFASYMAEKELSYIYPYVSRTSCYADFGEHSSTKTPLTFVQVPLMEGNPAFYRFGKYEELVHYDAFHERVLDDSIQICGIKGSKICMDLNQLKSDTLGKRYVVTASELPYKKIGSFGLSLRPISMNIISNVSGNQLFMYELDEGETLIRPWGKKRDELRLSLSRMKYEYRDAAWQILLYYAPREFLLRVKDRIRMKIGKR